MKNGYWGNYETGRIFLIDEHELWVRRPNNACSLGLSEELIARFSEYKIREDRDAFLYFLFANAPIMRFRGHGEYVTFEFNSPDWTKPLKLIHTWCQENTGPYTGLKIVNFHTMEIRQLLWQDFQDGSFIPV